MAVTEAADDDMLRVLPFLELQEAQGDCDKLPGKLLDGGMDQRCRDRIVAAEILVELRFGEAVRRRVVERILFALRADFLAPTVEDIPEAPLLARSPMKPSLSFSSPL